MSEPHYMDSIEACAAHYGKDADAMRDYLISGHKRAVALDNRGPIEFDENGDLARHIVDAYRKYGFYVFTNVLQQDELDDIKQDLAALKTRFPSGPGEKLTADGAPGPGSGLQNNHPRLVKAAG